ncbi:MAG: histidinol dehydrogenase, partial [Rhodanobacteraceae bacterium]
MRRIDWAALDAAGRAEALARPRLVRGETLRGTVEGIVADVRERGDGALREYAERFDRATLGGIEVSEAGFDAAEAAVDPVLKQAIAEAASRIEAFHRACMPEPVAVETARGLWVERVSRPIQRVGLYVPAGSAPLPSTVLMLA